MVEQACGVRGDNGGGKIFSDWHRQDMISPMVSFVVTGLAGMLKEYDVITQEHHV